MKTKIIALTSLAALLGTGAYFGVQAQTAPTTAVPVRMRAAKREKHPELVRALKALQHAKADLNKAARDYDGHRAKAAEATENAIREVQAAIASDRK